MPHMLKLSDYIIIYKAFISKKIFEESAALPFSQNKAEKYAQIRFLTNACVDTME